MHTQLVDYKDTGYFSDIVLDYLSGSPELNACYNLPFNKDSFSKLVGKRNFDPRRRSVLTKCLEQQYERGGISLDQRTPVKTNISLLEDEKSFTVTTGHQLCLFTGPLYFIYKIFSTINLAEKLKQANPGYNFVPVYWMASEDHDFEEVNHFHLFGKNVTWHGKAGDAVGRMSTEGMESVLQEFKSIAGDRQEAGVLAALFEQAYLRNQNLSDATRYLVNHLFGRYGLVCLDGDDASLKAEFREIMRDDLENHVAYRKVTETNAFLGKKYKIQVNPREINLFYLSGGSRKRFVKSEIGNFSLAEDDTSFDKTTIFAQLEDHPERFSPNVVLRPLYQETVLPNLAYIGGGGEIAYWLQLKALFDHYRLGFPLLVLRNSALWVDNNSMNKLRKNGVTEIKNLFLSPDELVNIYTRAVSETDLEFREEERQLAEVFGKLNEKAVQVDKSLVAFVNAEHHKTANMLKDLRNRLMRAEKKNHETSIGQLKAARERLFPGGVLQERKENFSALYLSYGQKFFDTLKEKLDPFTQEFIVFYEAGD